MKTKSKSIIAEKIKLLRNSKKITQTQLAEYTGLSMSAIRSYENGLREPNSKAMVALERFFNVTGEYLRGESNDTDSLYIWEDLEIMDAVQENFPNLIDKLLRCFLSSSVLEQKMLFDIMSELCHIASLKKVNPAFKASAFFLMDENFTQTTRFIDFCNHLPASSDIENGRLEKYKLSCVENFENSLSKFQNTLAKQL